MQSHGGIWNNSSQSDHLKTLYTPPTAHEPQEQRLRWAHYLFQPMTPTQLSYDIFPSAINCSCSSL